VNLHAQLSLWKQRHPVLVEWLWGDLSQVVAK
jgi:hypothetical protein